MYADRTINLNEKSPDNIKEKTYTTKQIETSITLLSSKEEDVVIDALLFLSKYSDIKKNNLLSLHIKGCTSKLLSLLPTPNLCILRLSIRLLSNLINTDNDEILFEIDQECNDKYIIMITKYLDHDDIHVRKFAVCILSKITKSYRIVSLIFEMQIFDTIPKNIKTCKDQELLLSLLRLFYEFLNSPLAVATLPTFEEFDPRGLYAHLSNQVEDIRDVVFNILYKCTWYNIDALQVVFNKTKLVETMLDVVMNPKMEQHHIIALEIILNCMKSDYSNSDFIESLQFLNFCQFILSCDEEYLTYCSCIVKELTQLPKIKQTLFDLSIEIPILHFLTSKVLAAQNDACTAISNMSVHKYCLDAMLTPEVVQTLFELLRNPDGTINEIALKTIRDIAKKSPKTIIIIYDTEVYKILLEMFFKQRNLLNDESVCGLIEIIYKLCFKTIDIVNEKLFDELMMVVMEESYGDEVTTLCFEIFSYFIENKDFLNAYNTKRNVEFVLELLQSTKNEKLFKTILFFLYSCCIKETTSDLLIKCGVVEILRKLPEKIKIKSPIITKIIQQIYSINLPLKLHELGKLDVSDRISNRFYLIDNTKCEPFPILDNLINNIECPRSTIFYVDYSYDILYTQIKDVKPPLPGWKFDASDLDFTDIPPDPYMVRYIDKMSKELNDELKIEEKVKILALYIDSLLSGTDEGSLDKYLEFKIHVMALKWRLRRNIIPVGFLRLGFYRERSLLFKALADRFWVPCSLVRGENGIYWNEVALFKDNMVVLYVVDLMRNVGELLESGSREAEIYCAMPVVKLE